MRARRRSRQLTQDALAHRAELSADTIRRLEYGAFSPSVDTLSKLCVGLELSISRLFHSFEHGEEDEQLMQLIDELDAEERHTAWRLLRVVFEDT